MGLTQSVRVWTRTAGADDPMGEPTYTWTYVDVDRVLVREGTVDSEVRQGDAASDLRPDGVRVKYTLAFPKGYDGPSLRHARVTLLDPMYGMDLGTTDGWKTALAVSGDPHPAIRPTRWDMLAEVGRSDG